MTDRPRRIQRQRTRGWRMPAGAVYVGRPTRWGNPWTIGKIGPYNRSPVDPVGAVGLFSDMLTDHALRAAVGYPSDDVIRRYLAGRDLACWCPLDQPCHADVLLEIANAPEPGDD
jgi:hypothetical protein